MQPDATSESGAHLELTPSGFAALMGAAADAVVIIDRHGSILNFNHAAERLFGYRTQDVVGRNVSLLMTEPDRNSHDGYLRQYLKTGRAHIIGIGRRVTALHADGRCMPVEISVGEYSDAGRLYFVGILRDLSERERYERALKESEERLRAREEELQVTLGRAPIGILSIDPDDRILDANQAACELVGYEEAELLRIPYTALLHPDEVENTKLHRIRLLGGDRKTFVVNSRYLHRDGSVVHVVLHCAIIYGADGEPERFIAQLVDRTDQVRAEQEANEARERLAQVDRVSTMGEMASGIAHEINQPLSAISSYVQACRRRLDSDHPDIPRLRELLAKADEQSLRAGKIVERIRALIRSQDRLRDRARLDDIVSDSLRMARTDANSRDLDLSISPRRSRPRGDRRQYPGAAGDSQPDQECHRGHGSQSGPRTNDRGGIRRGTGQGCRPGLGSGRWSGCTSGYPGDTVRPLRDHEIRRDRHGAVHQQVNRHCPWRQALVRAGGTRHAFSFHHSPGRFQQRG